MVDIKGYTGKRPLPKRVVDFLERLDAEGFKLTPNGKSKDSVEKGTLRITWQGTYVGLVSDGTVSQNSLFAYRFRPERRDAAYQCKEPFSKADFCEEFACEASDIHIYFVRKKGIPERYLHVHSEDFGLRLLRKSASAISSASSLPIGKRANGIEQETEDTADDEAAPFDDNDAEENSTEDYALETISVLVDHVLQQRDGVMPSLTYTEVAERIGRRNKHGVAWAHGMGYVLARATALIDALPTDGADPLPYLTTIIVSDTPGANRGLPGEGVKERWPGYELMSRSAKEDKVALEYLRILNFGSRWNEVLVSLGLPKIGVPALRPELKEVRSGGWGGGESLQHKALKIHVQHNPQLVGADLTWRSTNEHALRSADELDVFFWTDGEWIGVEVKSSVSDGNEKDYERGLYQAVKYKAVLLAQAKVDSPCNPPEVKVFLVLENALPKKYKKVAALLGINLLENVRPNGSGEADATCTAG